MKNDSNTKQVDGLDLDDFQPYEPPRLTINDMTVEALQKQEKSSFRRRLRALAKMAKEDGDEHFERVGFDDGDIMDGCAPFKDFYKWLVDSGKLNGVYADLEERYGDRCWIRCFRAQDFMKQLYRVRKLPADTSLHLVDEDSKDMELYRKESRERIDLWLHTLWGENPSEDLEREHWIMTDVQTSKKSIKIYFYGNRQKWCWESKLSDVSQTAMILKSRFKHLGKGTPVTVTKYRIIGIADRNTGIIPIDMVWTA